MKRIIAMILLSSLFPVIASAQTYYVDATFGDDTRDGQSEVNAWQTIARVNGSFFLPGDSVLFKCGETWRETLVIPSSGTTNSPIIFGSYPAGCPGANKPQITGSQPVTGWTQYTGNIYYVADANFENSPRNLITNGGFDIPPSWSFVTPAGTGGGLTHDSADANNSTGSGSLKFTSGMPSTTGNDHHAGSRSFTVQEGMTYRVSFKIRTDPNKTVGRVIPRIAEASWKFYNTFTAITANDEWIPYGNNQAVWSGDYTIPISGVPDNETFNVNFYIYLDPTYQNQGQVTVYLDDVQVVQTTPYPATVKQVFVDGVYLRQAQYPDNSDLVVDASSEVCAGATEGACYLTDNELDAGMDLAGAGVHLRTKQWYAEDMQVRATNPFDGASHRLYFTAATKQSVNAGNRYYLDNKYWMLSEGEWYFDSVNRRLFIWLAGGENPAAHTVEVSTVDTGILAEYRKHVALEGMRIRHAGDDGMFWNSSPSMSADGLDISASGGSGISLANSPNSRILNSLVDGAVHHGIFATASPGLTLTRNRVLRAGVVGSLKNTRGGIVMADQSEAMIANNTVEDSGYNGITFLRNSTVQNNIVRRPCLALDDCGGIYTYNGNNYGSVPVVGSQLLGNLVEDTDEVGIYLDNLARNVVVRGNTMRNVGTGIHMNNPVENVIEENTIYGSSRAHMDMVEGYGAPSNTAKENQVRNNILFPSDDTPALNLVNPATTPVNFGSFSDNVYSNLFGKRFVWETYYLQYSGVPYKIENYRDFDLPEWRAVRTQDLNSVIAPVFAVAPFDFDLPNGRLPVPLLYADFDYDPNNVPGTLPYRPLVNCDPDPAHCSGAEVRWREQALCEGSTSGGCLEFIPIDTSDTASVQVPVSTLFDGNGAEFPVESGATYLVQFKLWSRLPDQNLRLRIIGSTSWTDIGFIGTKTLSGLTNGKFIVAGPQWRDYAFVFTATNAVQDTMAKVNFWSRVATAAGPSMLMDSLRVRKVTGQFNDPADDTRIVINETSVTQPMPCPDSTPADLNPPRCGQYIDLTGAPVDWNAPMAPFTSRIVVWNNNPLRDTDQDSFSDSDDNCPLIPNPNQADSNQDGYGDVCSADLTLAITDTPDPALINDNISYVLTITNNGPSPASDVTVTDVLPSGTSYVSATPSQGSCSGTSTVTCNLGTLANSAVATVTIVAKAISAGTKNNTATVSSVESDPNASNNTFTASTSVLPTCSSGSYKIKGAVRKDSGSGPRIAGVTLRLTKPGCGDIEVTTSNSAYSFTGLNNGIYTLVPSKTGCTFSPVSRSITVNNGDVTGWNKTGFTGTGASCALN